jgi:hypothetical protein
VQEVSEAFGRFFERDHKGDAIELFTGKVQEGDNAKL